MPRSEPISCDREPRGPDGPGVIIDQARVRVTYYLTALTTEA
jgi:hypothetical protein